MELDFWLIIFATWLLINGYLALAKPTHMLEQAQKSLSLISDNSLFLQVLIYIPVAMIYTSHSKISELPGLIVFILGLLGLFKLLFFILAPEKFVSFTEKIFLNKSEKIIRVYGFTATSLSVVLYFLAIFIY
jgi:hypothetical protein